MLSTIVWGACMFGFALSQNYVLSLGLLLVRGDGQSGGAIDCSDAGAAAGARPRSAGRVVGVYNMASSGLRAGSGFSIGLVGGLIGIHWSLGLSALILLVVVIGCWSYTTARSRGAGCKLAQRLQAQRA